MENKVYGYARVSTREQNEDRQMIAWRIIQCQGNKFILIN